MAANTLLRLCLLLATLYSVSAIAPLQAQETESLNQQIQSIKQQTLELNRDLFMLEEELLYPSSTRLSIYVSLDVGEFFQLDAVKLSVDGTVVSNYLYTERQVSALRRGGVQRLYMGNIKSGAHEIVAVFTGIGPHQRDYRRATELRFEKAAGEKNLELKIIDSEATGQPDFRVVQW